MNPTPQKFLQGARMPEEGLPRRASWGRLPGISQVVIVKPASMSYSHRHCSDPQRLSIVSSCQHNCLRHVDYRGSGAAQRQQSHCGSTRG